MKFLVLLSLVLSGFSANALIDSNYDGDMGEIYLSWCDQNNVLRSTNKNPSGFEIAENCTNSGKTCVANQKTRGKYVVYYANCLDTSKPDNTDYRDN